MAESVRLIIAGSRWLKVSDAQLDRALAAARVEWQRPDLAIRWVLSGMSGGADRAGERWAKARGHAFRPYPADWRRYGISAGPERNARMAADADALIAFWDGASSGTRDMICQAYGRRLLVHVVAASEVV